MVLGVDLDEPERPGLVDLRYRAGHDVEPLVSDDERAASVEEIEVGNGGRTR